MLFPSDNKSLNDYLESRAILSAEEKRVIGHPELLDRWDAFYYWLEVMRQDNPILLAVGTLMGAAMVLHMVWRTIASFL